MAIYHTNLKYHEDTVEKRNIKTEDLEFLKDLQKEMNTQDHCGTASPRFWVIKGTERECGIDNDYKDGCFVECEGDEVFSTIEESYDYFCRLIDENEIKIYKVEYIDEENKEDGIYLYKDNNSEWDFEFNSIEDIFDWLDTYDDSASYCLVNYRNIEKIYPDTMFFTQKGAEEHLRANSHNYSYDAHTYCMSAIRSPEVAKLYEIIRSVDWNKIEINKEG